MDYIRVLHLQNDFQMIDLTKSLSQLENEIIKDANLKGFNKESLIIKELFAIAGKEEYKMPKERWDIVRFNIYTFITAHTPNNHLIPDISQVAHTKYGPLFFVLTILSIMNTENQQADFIMDCFLKVKDKILNQEETSPYKFYSISTATYTNLLPSLASKKFQDKIKDTFVDFFTNLKQKIEESEKKLKNPLDPPNFKEISPHSVQISYSTHQFFLELLKSMMKIHRNQNMESPIIMIHTLWHNPKASSTLLPIYINFINHLLLTDKPYKGTFPFDKDRIARMLADNTRFRHNDIFKMMPPNQVFEFFNRASSNDRTKNKYTLRFICQLLFADNQRELFVKMRSAHDDNMNINSPNREDNKFIFNQIQQYNKGHARFSLLFFLEQLSSAFGCLRGTIKQIKAIKIGPSSQNYKYFSEQVRDKSDLTELDDLLYSKYEYISYDNKEDALKAYEKCFKYIDLFQEKSILPFSFFQKLMESDQNQIHLHDEKNPNGMKVDGSNSSLFFNVRRVFTSFFELIIEIGYRYMLLSQFLFSDVCLTPQVNRCYQKCSRFDLSNVRNTLKKIADIFNKPELSDQTLQSYAKIISDLLFQAVKKRYVTNQLVTYLYIFNTPPDPRNPNDSRLYQMIINNMLQFIYTSTPIIDQLNVEDANDFHQYFLLLLHLGRKLRKNLPQFMTNLRQYQKSFITILLNRFRCTNQREFLNSMVQCIRLLNENNDNTLENLVREMSNSEEMKKKPPHAIPRVQAPLLRYAMSDYRKELKNISTHLILDRSVIDQSKTASKHIILSYLTSAFQSSDPNLIQKGLRNILQNLLNTTKPELVKENQQLYFDNDSDNFRPFYTSLFKSLLKSYKEDSLRIIEIIPQLLLLFNSFKTNITSRQVGFIIPRYQVDLFNILKYILIHFSGKESEAIHILMFLSTLINDDSFSQNLDKMPISIIEQLITNLTALFGYKIIRQKVINLFKILHKKFLPIVANGNYNYILSLFFNVSFSYSEGSSLYIKVIEMFFKMAEIPDSPTFNADRIVNTYFSQNRIINYNELLVFMIIIQKKWPKGITNDHLSLFFLALSINHPAMIIHTKSELYSKPFNEFLKVYISNLEMKDQNNFLKTIIQYVESSKLIFHFKVVIFKRIRKGHFPTPFKNFNHILAMKQEKEPFLLMLYLTLLFGVKSKEPLPDEIFRRTVEEMKKFSKENMTTGQQYLLLMIYFIRIILDTQPDNSRYFSEDILKLFLNIINIANSRMSQIDPFKKQVKICLKLLSTRASVPYEKVTKEVMDINLNSNNNPNYFQNLKKIVRYASLFPECIQPDHIRCVFYQLLEFTKLTYEQKIRAVGQAIKFSIFLSYPDYKSQQGMLIKQFLNSEYENHLSYFAYLIHIFIVLLSDNTFISNYSFYDSIVIFVNNFKRETIDVILNHNFVKEIEQSYDFLYDLITEDKTDEFFNFTMERFDELSRNEEKPQMMQMAGGNVISSQPHIAALHPAFFNVLNRLSKNERFSHKPGFGDHLIRFFHSVMLDKRNADNKTTIMNILIDSAIEAVQYQNEKKHIIFIINYIQTSSVNTPLYRKWKELLFKNKDRKFYVENFIYYLENYSKLGVFEVVEIILVQLLKGLKSLKKEESLLMNNVNDDNNETEVDLDELFLNTMRKMIVRPESLCCAMGCFVVYFKYNKPDSHNLPLALSGFGPALSQPNSYCIIHVFKLANILLGDMYYNNIFNSSSNDSNNDNDDKNENKDEEEDTNSNEKPNNENLNESNFDENKVYLPLPILSDLIQHVLYFPKFLDLPYSLYVSTLFRNANKLFNKNNIPDSLADCFKQFVIPKIVKCKELDKVNTVIQMMPVLVETVPFSLVYAAFHNIDLCAQHMRNNTFRIEDNFTVVFFAVKYLQKFKMTEDEESYIFKFSFNFLREILKGEITQVKPNIDLFLRPLMSKGKYMPPDLLDIASQKFTTDAKITPLMRALYSAFGVLATESVDAQILLKHIDFIQKAFEFNAQKMNPYNRIYTQNIFNRPELENSKLVDHFFNILQNFANLEVRVQLLGFYVSSSKHCDKLKYLTSFWNKELPPIHYQRLSGHIENLPINQQSIYLNLILERTRNYRIVLYPVFITNFINSSKVSNLVKIEFLEKLPTFIDELDALFTYKLYEAIQSLEFDTFGSQMLLLFYSLVKINDSSRLIYYQKLKNLSGDTEEERFITLTKVIPPYLWTNTNLPFISLIIIDNKNRDFYTDSSKMDIPLIMLSEMFASFSSDFMTSILTRIINDRTHRIIHTLLTECLAHQLKQREQPPDTTKQIQTPQQKQKNQNQKKQAYVFDNYTQIVTAIIKAFHKLSIPIQPILLYKSLKLSNDFSLFSCMDTKSYSFENDNNPFDMIPDKLLLPHKVNDIVYSNALANTSIETLSASAQFFLGNYEEAEKMFQRVPFPENKVVDRLQQITSDIVMKMKLSDSSKPTVSHALPLPISSSSSSLSLAESQNQQNRSKFAIFSRFEHEDNLLVPFLEHAYSPQRSGENSSGQDDTSYKIEQLLLAEHCNVLYFKHHPHLSHYERERLSGIECIIMLMRSKLKKLKQAASNPASIPPSAVSSVTTTPAPSQAPNALQVPVPMNVSTPLTQPVLSSIQSQQSQTVPMMPQIDQQQMQMGRLNVITSPQPPQPPQQPQQQQQLQYRSPQMPRQMTIIGQPPQQPPTQQPNMNRNQFLNRNPQMMQQRAMSQGRPQYSDLFNFKLNTSMHYIVESCLPPPMSKLVIDFSREMSKDSNSANNNNNNGYNNRITQQSPFIVFSSEFRPFFSDMDSLIEPIDFHGFFAINSNSLFSKFNYYLTNLPKKQSQLNPKQQQEQQQQQQQMMASFDPFLWPSFCFNIFASSEKSSEVLFRVTLESYLHLLTEEKIPHPANPAAQSSANPQAQSSQASLVLTPLLSMPPFLCLAASARVMNLFSYAVSNQIENQVIFNAALKCCNLIIPDQTTPHLKTWMPQLVNLRSEFPSVFSERTECLVINYAHTATLMAHRMEIRPKPELKKVVCQLDILSRICDKVFNISNSAFERAREKKRENNNNNNKVFFTTMEDIDINDLTEEEQKIYNSFFIDLSRLNQVMPFDYDRRSCFMMKNSLKIVHFHPNFAKLSDNALTFTALTMGPLRQRFIVERVQNTDSAVTFSNVLEGVKNVFKYGYSSRLRRIRLSSHPAMELGPNLVMRLFPIEIFPIGTSLKLDEVKINNDNDNDNNRVFDDEFDFYDFGRNKNFDVDDRDQNKNFDVEDKNTEKDDEQRGWLRRKMMAMYTEKDYFKMRRALIANFAAYSVIRNMFSLNQPKEKDFFISLQTAEFPFIIGDMAIPDKFGETASLINEELQLLFGDSFTGEITMAIAAASDALAKHIDAVRSLVEVPLVGIFDSREKNFDIVLSKRDLIDASILSFAPPLLTNRKKQNTDTDNANEEENTEKFVEESSKWITNIQRFVNNSFDKFDRVLYNDDFVQANKLNMNINMNNLDTNSISGSNSALSSLDNNSIFMDFTDINSRNNSSNNNNNNENLNISPFLFGNHDFDDQGDNNFDNDSKDDQIDDFDLF